MGRPASSTKRAKDQWEPRDRGCVPRLCTATAAATAVGGARRDRTDDLLLAKQALSQLSYGPDTVVSGTVVPTTYVNQILPGVSPLGIASDPQVRARDRVPRLRLVEPDGIEPTTSCLQSRRSPN